MSIFYSFPYIHVWDSKEWYFFRKFNIPLSYHRRWPRDEAPSPHYIAVNCTQPTYTLD